MSGKTPLNAVYVARKGDTMKSLSDKIYSKNRIKDFKKWNPSLSTKLRVGDKVYYNSPQRAEDTTKMLTFYEDNGVPAQLYTAKDGDDLKSVAKVLLGDRNGWKELYVTNPNLESKDKLGGGTELRYWPETNAMPQKLADNAQPPAPPTEAAHLHRCLLLLQEQECR